MPRAIRQHYTTGESGTKPVQKVFIFTAASKLSTQAPRKIPQKKIEPIDTPQAAPTMTGLGKGGKEDWHGSGLTSSRVHTC